MPISRTHQPGDVGTMPPRPQPAQEPGMKLSDLTQKQLIALCELRGIGKVSKTQRKAYYIKKLSSAGNDAPPTQDELDNL